MKFDSSQSDSCTGDLGFRESEAREQKFDFEECLLKLKQINKVPTKIESKDKEL